VQKASKQKEDVVVGAAAETEAIASAKKALKDHRAELLAEKEALSREKDFWESRRKAVRRGGHLVTVADELGHFEQKSVVTVIREHEVIAHRKELIETSKDFELQQAKIEWEARHNSASGGHTQTDDLGHFSQTTATVISRRKAYEKQQEEKRAAENKMAAEKAAWMARVKKNGRTTAFVRDDSHFEADTAGARNREADRQSVISEKAAAAQAEADVGNQWRARQKQHHHSGDTHGATKAEDIGRLARQTESAMMRKQTWEAEKREAILKAKADEEERLATARLWTERQAKKKKAALVYNDSHGQFDVETAGAKHRDEARQAAIAEKESAAHAAEAEGDHLRARQTKMKKKKKKITKSEPIRMSSLDRIPDGGFEPETPSDTGTFIGTGSWDDEDPATLESLSPTTLQGQDSVATYDFDSPKSSRSYDSNAEML